MNAPLIVKRARRWLGWGSVATVIGVAALLLWPGQKSGPAGQYVTDEAITGNLTVTVAATGTLQPIRTVDLGSELSGTLEAVLVKENEHVRKGQVVARLDMSKLNDQVTKSRAAVAAAHASVRQMAATVTEARTTLNRLRKISEKSGGGLPSQSDLDAAAASYERSLANVGGAEAAVAQAQATLKSDETNIKKASIRSPIDGVVLTRKVEPGQTVVAAMNAPVLFVLAEDLKKMELQVKVDEADVAGVVAGQSASFTVAAWLGRRFDATVDSVGMGSTITDNVVTYKTVLKVNNDDLALRPGMTATARIVTGQRQNALLVPSAALRFVPPDAPAASAGIVSKLLPKPPQRRRLQDGGPARIGNTKIWVLRDSTAVAIPVTTGLTNGRQTEIIDGELEPGMAVITEFQSTAK
jgi:HlyD family secretion protein